MTNFKHENGIEYRSNVITHGETPSSQYWRDLENQVVACIDELDAALISDFPVAVRLIATHDNAALEAKHLLDVFISSDIDAIVVGHLQTLENFMISVIPYRIFEELYPNA